MEKMGTIMGKESATGRHLSEKRDNAAFDACPITKMDGFLCQVDNVEVIETIIDFRL
jgi:hypothetical protein